MANWTEGRLRSFITSTIRSGFRRYPEKYETLAKACVGVKTNKATGRQAKHYKCEKCKKLFVGKDVQVDHITPVVCPTLGFVDWDTFIKRLFCPANNLQVLCKPCHLAKTNKERQQKKEKK